MRCGWALLVWLVMGACGVLAVREGAAADSPFSIATFSVDVTPGLGHALLASAVEPAKRIDDRLFLHGVILLGGERPIVWAGIDWCEIRNDAYDAWRDALAEAAGTDRQRVLLSCLHQHDAPLADLTAERLCAEAGIAHAVCDPAFHAACIERAQQAVRQALKQQRPITHLGLGQAKVEKVASTRRIVGPNGKVVFIRDSTSNARGFEEPEGRIDPWLKTISFWDGEQPVVAISCYATHPMSHYGKGAVSADFVGLARRLRQAETPGVMQIYLSGCSGNVTAGKYNDGSPANRAVLAERVHRAMREAWQQTRRHRLSQIAFRVERLDLPPRNDEGYSIEALRRQLHTPSKRLFDQVRGAMGLSWRMRLERGEPVDLPAVDFGVAQVVLFPGETFVEYQLLAQAMRPDVFVMAVGYGEAAPGYIPLDKNFDEGGNDLEGWCWVRRGAEAVMRRAMRAVLDCKPTATDAPDAAGANR